MTVNLTDGEVKHWGPDYERILVVVDQILWQRNADSYETSGGRARVWSDWEIEPESLEPTEYRYTLPAGALSPLGAAEPAGRRRNFDSQHR